jgi:hypothetical protein
VTHADIKLPSHRAKSFKPGVFNGKVIEMKLYHVGRIAMRALALVAMLMLAGCEDDGLLPPTDSTPPRARIRLMPPYGPIGTEFMFDASPSGDDEDSLVLEVRWDFGADEAWDTDYSLDKMALRRYDKDGTFPVLLEVRNTSGLLDTAKTWVHLFFATECTASAEPTAGTAPLAVAFDAVATGGHGIFSFLWEFGDGDTLWTQRPDHVFQTPGTYDVVLRVVDLVYDQPDCFDTLRIDVAAPPASALAAESASRPVVH